MRIIDPSFTWLGCAPDGDQMMANIADFKRIAEQRISDEIAKRRDNVHAFSD
nr:MAG TPA: hypothetical protein [Caudoviricetes sp.]